MPRILMIVGSLREHSFNRQLAREVERIIGDRAEVSYLDWRDVPFMGQDIEWPTPEPVAAARAAVLNADGLWFFSPEYNYQIPGGLKNLLDWLSRPLDEHDRTSPSAIKGKRAAVSGVGGRGATAGMRKDLERLFAAIGVERIGGPSLGFALSPEEWTSDTLALEPGTMGALEAAVDDYLAALER